ncbi:MAG: YggS family pyridoxal phosphate-dependent enzyme [Cyanobacteria bacterium J06627_28]
MSVFEERLQKIQSRIPSEVMLIAVTKTFASAVVREAYAAGIRDFGENKIQEALEKQEKLRDLTGVTWHFIGHLQSNKTRKALNHFDWIHSVDSLKLVQRLDRQAAELGKCPNCCLQVKLAPDDNKSGFEVDELMVSLAAIAQLQHLNIRGLMVIAPYGLPAADTQLIFERGRQLITKINDQLAKLAGVTLQLDQLSMGMSGDFELAIAQGATMVRLGSGLFGQR